MLNQYHAETFDEAYIKICKDLVDNPDYEVTNRKGEKLYELYKPTIVVEYPEACLALSRNLSLPYLQGELEFYLSGSPYLTDIAYYSKFWNKVSDDGYTINSNYGRLALYDRNSHNLTQFEYALQCLERNPDSKKAVVTIYNKDHARTSNDNPCTMYLHFFIRDGRLDIIVNMRSSDIWFGMPYDVPFFHYLQRRMAKALEIPVGRYIHTSDTLHVYERNIMKIKEASRKVPESHHMQRGIFLDVLTRAAMNTHIGEDV